MFTSAEKRNLSVLLARAVDPDDALTLDGLHGLLFGLAIIPELIMPSEWFPAVFGVEMAEFADEIEAEKLLGYLVRAYKRILDENERGKLDFPFDMTKLKDGDLVRIREWAYGLYRAMSLRPETWGIDDEERDEAVFSEDEREVSCSCGIILGVALPEEVPEIFPTRPDTTAQRDETKLLGTVYALLPQAVAVIRDHANRMRSRWQQQGVDRLPRAIERSLKIGRNDPCPCGSGKKYKKCCGGA